MKVTELSEIVPSDVSVDESPMVTSAVGCEFRTMVKSSAPPASVVVPDSVLRVIPTASSSVLVTATSVGFTPL